MRIAEDTPLHGAVIALLGRADAVLLDAVREPLEYDAFLAHRTVSRIRGTAIVDGSQISWSMVEKVTEGPELASPYLVDNAEREYSAYTSGLLDDLAPGIRAPRLLASTRESSGRLSLWLEEVPNRIARPLDGETILAAAHDLGRLAGRWAGRVPQHPWLFTGWIDRHSQPEAVEEGLGALGRAQAGASIRSGSAGEAVQLVHAQGRVRGILERLPQTLCHHDAVGANVFRLGGETVLIDWESVGPGPVGADLASLLFSSARRGDCSAALAASLVEPAVDAYLAGARMEAPALTVDTVRRGFDASVALRWKLVRDVVDAVERGGPIRRGSAPHESPEEALAELDVLIGLLFECSRRVLRQ